MPPAPEVGRRHRQDESSADGGPVLAATRRNEPSNVTFGVDGKGEVAVLGDAETVEPLADSGFVFTRMRAGATTLAERLIRECERAA